MQFPDFDVIKEVPGYKAILKSVLKSQIQQLVEQLAEETGEESVLLTASVSDGSLSELGSNTGRIFLDDHDEIKSQFLGFCFKRQSNDKKSNDQNYTLPRRKGKTSTQVPGRPSGQNRTKVTLIQVQSSSEHSPVQKNGDNNWNSPEKHRKTKQSGKAKIAIEAETGGILDMNSSSADAECVKKEFSENIDSTQDVLHDSVEISTATNYDGTVIDKDIALRADTIFEQTGNKFIAEDKTNVPLDLQKIVRETQNKPELNLNMPFSGKLDTDFQDCSTEMTNIDTDVEVKVEAITDSDMELEIMGFKPAKTEADVINQTSITKKRRYSSQVGGQHVARTSSQHENFKSGALNQESGLDIYSTDDIKRMMTDRSCPLCGKLFPSTFKLQRHILIHTGDKPYECQHCLRRFNQKNNLERHQLLHFKL